MAEENKDVGVVMLKNVRLNSFDDGIYNPEEEIAEKGKHKGKLRSKWGARFIFPPKGTKESNELERLCKAAMGEAKRAGLKDEADTVRIKGDNLALRDGDDMDFNGHHGALFVSAAKTVYSSGGNKPKRPFRVIGARKVRDPETGQMRFPDMKLGESGAPYSGCYVNAKVQFWYQGPMEGSPGHKINASIEAIQFCGDGEPFGGGGVRTNVEDEFEDMGGEDMDLDDLSTAGSSYSVSGDDDLGI